MATTEDWDWLTPTAFVEFAQANKVRLDCDRCPSQFPNVFIDTVTKEGLIPRSSTFGINPDTGNINMGSSRHLPCVRVICRECGHVELFSMYSVKAWKTGKPYGES